MYYESNYRHRKKYRLKPVPIICVLLAFAIIIGGIYFLFFKKDKYADYKIYNENNKNYGTVMNFEDNTDDFYTSVFYPKLKDKNLNSIVKTTYQD